MEHKSENARVADQAKLQRSEQAYRKALRDVRTFTSKQVLFASQPIVVASAWVNSDQTAARRPKPARWILKG